jgi:hypothetical protein
VKLIDIEGEDRAVSIARLAEKDADDKENGTPDDGEPGPGDGATPA